MDEFGIIDRFFNRQHVRREDVVLGIGDDAAVVNPAAGASVVVTTDVLVNGVHFPEDAEPEAVGHKALAVNLSDIAAMGAEPAWATMGLTLPGVDESWLDAFSVGFFSLAEQFNVQLIGGDITRGPLTIAVQVMGIVGEGSCMTRGGARENDLIYVSGTLGDAALGLQGLGGMIAVSERDLAYLTERLHRPAPRVALARAIAPLATAAIDISDGLAADLGHICEASRVGAVVDVANLPLSDAYRRCLTQVGWEPAASFGDDYELCFTISPDDAERVERIARGVEPAITRIGRITGDGIRWMYGDKPVSIHEQGYQHFR
jgi:thiamine-monophosphate kinase